jgi:hypothetical protein
MAKPYRPFCNYHGVYFVKRDITNSPAGRAARSLTGQSKVYEHYCPKCRTEGMTWERAQGLVKQGAWDKWVPRKYDWQ